MSTYIRFFLLFFDFCEFVFNKIDQRHLAANWENAPLNLSFLIFLSIRNIGRRAGEIDQTFLYDSLLSWDTIFSYIVNNDLFTPGHANYYQISFRNKIEIGTQEISVKFYASFCFFLQTFECQ